VKKTIALALLCTLAVPETVGSANGANDSLSIIEVDSVRSWKPWNGSCYGKVSHQGDGDFLLGVVEGTTIKCGFFLENVSRKILAKCPGGSVCLVRGRFEKQPSVAKNDKEPTKIANIEYVDSVVRMKQAPMNNSADQSSSVESAGIAFAQSPQVYILAKGLYPHNLLKSNPDRDSPRAEVGHAIRSQR
jgi:hypothetical protein